MTLAFILLEMIEFEVQTKTQENIKCIIKCINIWWLSRFSWVFACTSNSIISRSMNAKVILWYINQFVILSTIQIWHKKYWVLFKKIDDNAQYENKTLSKCNKYQQICTYSKKIKLTGPRIFDEIQLFSFYQIIGQIDR